LNAAKEGEVKENLYRLWLVIYPNYTKDNYESFEKFCENRMPKRQVIDTRSTDDIMQEMQQIEDKFKVKE